jgi:hypothetical protein
MGIHPAWAQVIIIPMPPSISAIPDQVTALDTAVVVNFTVDDDGGAINVSVVGTSSNKGLVSDSSIVISMPSRLLPGSRRATITPTKGVSGRTTITVTATDLTGRSSSRSFQLLVNTPPTVSRIPNQDILEGTTTGPIPVMVSDNESSFRELSVSATSRNEELIPTKGGIDLRLGANGWTIQLTPVPGRTGESLILVVVRDDGGASAETSFLVTVRSGNTPPFFLKDIPSQVTDEDVKLTVPFSVGDKESKPEALQVTAAAENTTLLPTLLIEGAGQDRTLTIVPGQDLSGETLVVLTVFDEGKLSATLRFLVTVRPVDDPPSITRIPSTSTTEGVPTSPLGFQVSDPDTPLSLLSLSTQSDNGTVVPVSNIQLSGSGSERSVVVTPLSGGLARLTITVSDGRSSASAIFDVTVNFRPRISDIQDRKILPGTSTGPIPFTISDVETPAASLGVSAVSSDATLVPNTAAALAFGGAGENRTLTVTPVSGRAGSAIITVTVTDGSGATASDSFFIIVNTPPTISPIANQTIQANSSTGPISFTVTDPEQSQSQLQIFALSDNTTLIPPTGGITLDRTSVPFRITITPAPNRTGQATITVSASDVLDVSERSFVLTVTSPNTPPAISDIPNQTLNEDSSVQVNFTVTDQQTTSITVSVSSPDVGLLPSTGLVLGGSGSSRSLTITPAPNQSGVGTVVVTANDGELSSSKSFVVTVNPVNDPPTISDIPNQTINEDTSTAAIVFLIGDIDTPLDLLTLQVTANNPTLLPVGSVVISAVAGSPSARTITVTPAPNQSGTATITVTVSDGQASASDSFVLTVIEVNDPPAIAPVANVTTAEDTPTPPIPVVLSDPDTPVTQLTLTASTDNPTLVPSSRITLGGSGANRTVVINPAPDQSGVATITLTVSDGALSSSRSFTISVTAVNDPPAISDIPNQTTNQNTPAGPIPFTVSDPDTPLTQLVLTGSSSNPTLVPAANIQFASSSTGNSRTVIVTPASGQSGTAIITITVSDGQASASDTFTLTVVAVATPPTISNIPDQTTSEDTAIGPIAFTIGDPDTPLAQLIVSGLSDNPTLVPSANIVFGGSGANRTVIITPAPNQFGTTVITLRVSDGTGVATATFVLTVAPVNDPPTISDIPNQVMDEDSTLGPIVFAIGDPDSPLTSLTVTAISDNPALISPNGILIGLMPSNPNGRELRLTPILNQSGAATITLTVSDGQASTSDSFVLTVRPVNDPPTITPIPDQSISANASAGPLSFTVGDVDTPIDALMVTAVGDNAVLIPPNGIVLGGSGANRTIRLTPAANQTGLATITITVREGTTVSAAQISFRLNVGAVPPKITLQPVSQSATVGDQIEFKVEASGTPPLKYEWLFNDSMISGVTGNSLSMTAEASREGSYQVKVSNSGGSDTSVRVTLTIYNLDFGDAPDPTFPTTLKNDGARHTIQRGVFLGARVDGERDGQPNTDATGDDQSPATADDEDGVQFLTALTPGQSGQIQVIASVGGFLDAWIDFNANGSWGDGGERIFTRQALVAGANALSFNVPNESKAASVFARFRFSLKGSETFFGLVETGEVEDYRVAIAEALLDFGDAPEPYPTKLAANGARHAINPKFVLGRLIDGEPDGQPSADARGDDGPPGAASDEDGVKFLDPLVPGTTVRVEVIASDRGILDAWIDFNQNGSWGDSGEHVFARVTVGAAANVLTFNVPADIKPGRSYARFRLSRQGVEFYGGFGGEGEVEDYLIEFAAAEMDFGDAPDGPYPTVLKNDGARHTIQKGFQLGKSIDAEPDGQPTGDADGDDRNPSVAASDEDGVVFVNGLTVGQTTQLQVTASDRGFLDAWVDFNGNGSWADAGERIFTRRSLGATVNNLTFAVPASAKAGDTYARFRLSRQGVETFRGPAPDGEVEDYKVTIKAELLDYGDAPEPYPTLLSQDGARHRVVLGSTGTVTAVIPGIHLGPSIDSEPDGQPNASALGDDINGAADEDGVKFLTPLIPGQVAQIEVYASTVGLLDAWVDFQRNGTWADRIDRIFSFRPLVPGPNLLTFSVPAAAAPGVSFARFRFSREGVKDFVGYAPDGEVEDYRVAIERREPCEFGCKGLSYWLTFPANYAPDPANPVKLTLYVIGDPGTAVNVEAPGLTPPYSHSVSIPPSRVAIISVPKQADLGDAYDKVESKGVQVKADRPVSVYGMNRVRYTTDGFYAIPEEVLGRDYIVQSYANIQTTAPDLNGTQFALVATQPDTKVTVRPSWKIGPHPKGIAYTITLQQGQTYQLRNTNDAPADLSGTLISADKPIAVFGSHRCANIESTDVWFCDYLVEQLMPVSQWGTQFLTHPLATRNGGDTLRIMAAQDTTVVAINGVPSAVLNQGEIYETTLGFGLSIIATKPIHVTQYANSSDYDGVVESDPFMIQVPSRGMYSREHEFHTGAGPGGTLSIGDVIVFPGGGLTIGNPGGGLGLASSISTDLGSIGNIAIIGDINTSIGGIGSVGGGVIGQIGQVGQIGQIAANLYDPGFSNHWVNIIAPSATAASGGVTLDGVSIPAAAFTPIAASGFSGTSRKVSTGFHKVLSPTPVAVSVYGWAKYDSYGFPTCFNFGDATPPVINCPEPFTVTLPIGSTAGTVANVQVCKVPIPDLRGQATYFDGCGLPENVAGIANFGPQVLQVPAPGTMVGPGVHTIALAIADARGNIGFCTTTMTVIDPNPIKEVVLFCPKEMITAVCQTDKGAVVQFAAFARAGCEEIPLKCEPPSGSVFPPGQTTVTCTLSDPRFPEQKCSFVVLVSCQPGTNFPKLNVLPAANGLILVGPEGTKLQVSENPTGPWRDVPGAQFPYPVNTSQGTKNFYRLKE